MLNKSYFLIGMGVVFFVLSLALVFVYRSGWDDPVDEMESSVQINLPVIDWDRYLNLSKQPE